MADTVIAKKKDAAAQADAAADFAERWKDRGYEKGETQKFWLELLGNVIGVENPTEVIDFEVPVQMDSAKQDIDSAKTTTKFIDAYIPETGVLIEQKGRDIDLRKGYKQSDGSVLTPFQQARRYNAYLPYNRRPRWIVVSNFREIHVHDMNRPNDEPIVVALDQLAYDYWQFQFLVAERDEAIRIETEISIEAGNIVAELHRALKERYINPEDKVSLESLNMLCVRLVFCLYAEDANIFEKGQFHDYLAKFDADGMREALIKLFQVLNQKEDERSSYLPPALAAFPYVNGGLFAKEDIEIPLFTDFIRSLVLDTASAGFDWSRISPTIFGAIFETTMDPDKRRAGGMHYTSIENIHKVIDPLFLNDLQEEFEGILELRDDNPQSRKKRNRKLREFQEKLGSLTFLDPACGSGNFLTETYLSLRRLENQALEAQYKGQVIFDVGDPIKVSIRQFNGIEINDFAVAVAQTALWIAENQTLRETEKIVHMDLEFLPLTTAAHIVEGNALRMDWENVVPKSNLDYIMGNPPFSGARIMSPAQKKDVIDTFGTEWKNSGNLDYVTCWFKKAADFMQRTPIRAALVATNSVAQGESVGTLWGPLFDDGVHIDFAWPTFRWDSEAKSKAHVHVVIVGFSTPLGMSDRQMLYGDNGAREADNINGYLIDGPNICVTSRQHSMFDVPEIGIGNKLLDWGHYLFSKEKRDEFVHREPASERWFKPFYGGKEFIANTPIYCLWLGHCPPDVLRQLPECMNVVKKVQEQRRNSKSPGTIKLAETPTRFHVENFPKGTYLAIPVVSSERRRYIPIGFMHDDVMCGQKLMLMPNATLYHFGVLTSNVHNAWMRTVAGRMKSDYSYSKDIVYNNFPWPNPTPKQKVKIEQTAQAILDARALYPDSSLADLYDETTMPPELRTAHQHNDMAVMEAYGFKDENGHWLSESETVARLMEMYAELTKDER